MVHIRSLFTLMACLLTLNLGATATAQTNQAQNLGAQSGIVAATSGAVRVVSRDVGRIAETGQKIYLNDVVETGANGKMQIMLMDRTTITIGPASSIVIDEFVYDPGVERSLSASVLKGTFKLASPTTFKQLKEKRELKLPNAVVAIRGTEFIASVTETGQDVVLLEGAITVANDAFAQDIERPNFGVSVNLSGEITPPSFVSAEDLGALLGQLETAPGQEGEAEASDAATEESTAEDDAAEDDGAEDQAEGETSTGAEEDATAEGEAGTAPAGEEAGAAAGEAEDTPPALQAFTEEAEDGPAPTEAEVAAAAEAVADGSADVADLRVLSRAGPASAAAVASILGVEIDEETGELAPASEAVLAPRIAAILGAEGLEGDTGFTAEVGAEFGAEFNPETGTITFGADGSGFTIEEGETAFSGFAAPERESFSFGLETSENSFGLSRVEAFAAPETGFSFGNDAPIEFERLDVPFETAVFEAPVIEFDPAAFEALSSFATIDIGDRFSLVAADFFLEPVEIGFSDEASFEEAGFEEAGFDDASYEDPGFDNAFGDDATLTPGANSLDDLVTEALEEVIESVSSEAVTLLPDHTYMPERSSYRSWNGSEWSTIAQNFSSGSVRFVHNNVTASHFYGSYCQDCTAQVSSEVTIDFSSMEYQFVGSGTFNKPGYEPVAFSETTPDIPLNYWELSSGTISRLPNERELESIYDNPTVHTLTPTTSSGGSITATIDLDFLYDSQLQDNSDVSSNLGVYGHSRVEYTETGSSRVTLKTPDEAMTPVAD